MIRHLSRGLTYIEIAEQLRRSKSTVRSQLHWAYARLGVSSGAHAVSVCMQAGWLDEVPHDGTALNLADRRVTWAQRLYLEAFDQSLRAGDDSAEVERTQSLRDAALIGLLREADKERPWRATASDPLERIARTLRRLDERSAGRAAVDLPDPRVRGTTFSAARRSAAA